MQKLPGFCDPPRYRPSLYVTTEGKYCSRILRPRLKALPCHDASHLGQHLRDILSVSVEAGESSECENNGTRQVMKLIDKGDGGFHRTCENEIRIVFFPSPPTVLAFNFQREAVRLSIYRQFRGSRLKHKERGTILYTSATHPSSLPSRPRGLLAASMLANT